MYIDRGAGYSTYLSKHFRVRLNMSKTVEFLSADNVDLLLKSRVLAFSTFGFAPLAINARDTMWKYQFYLIKCKYTVVKEIDENI